jgi:pyrroloquinoline quinone (PQQ) biosynthesis protein C
VTPALDIREKKVYALRPACRFDSCEPTTVIETEDNIFTFEGVAPPTFCAVLNRLDGRQSIGEIAAEIGSSVVDVSRICEALARNSLASTLKPNGTPPSADFAEICYKLFPVWKAHVFGHPLWRSLSDGTAKPSVFAGWLLETYHFIETVNNRLALAIAECRAPEARALFLHHYSEEWDHHHFFMKSLRSFGYEEEMVLRSCPLPGTLAVVNYMRDMARRDPLYYAACSGFLESTGEDRAGGREFFERLIRYYCPDNPNIVKPMRAHLDLDEDYGHNGTLSQIYSTLGSVSEERLEGALNAVAELVEVLDLWSSDILKTYAESGPRASGVRRYRPAVPLIGVPL